MLITGSSSSLLTAFISVLKMEFAMTDLGFVHYFLGGEITKTPHGLFLSQQRYIQQLLVKAKMADCMPISTPIVAMEIIPEDAEDYHDVTKTIMMLPSTGCWLDLFNT